MKTTDFALKENQPVTLAVVENAVKDIFNYVTNQPTSEWKVFLLHQHSLKTVISIEKLSNRFELLYFNCPSTTLVHNICLTYDSYSGNLLIWSEQFNSNNNETFLELQMEVDDEEYLEAVVTKYIELINNL